jgi:hypothetical protein
MMIVRKVIEYIYDRYVLNEQQQQQQQNTPMTTAGNGSSKKQKLILLNLIKIFFLDQNDGNSEQQRESDISKSVDHIELLCQDQVRILFILFVEINFVFIYRFWIYQWI